MATDTNVSRLVINMMTQAQYDAATKSNTELYLVPDSSSELIASLSSSLGSLQQVVTTNSSSWATNTDKYVNTASFASTGSNGANGVKMTLTRAGSDTGTVVATIPVASTTAAGVMTGAQVTNLNGAVASGSLAKNVTAITASLIASGALAKTAIQPAATASWKAASDWITANSSSALTDNDTKVTAVGNHYAPTASTEIAASITGSAGAFATNTEYTVITGIKAKVDAKGHVTDIKYTAQKVKDTTIANTDRYVNTAAFVSTGSSGSLGVKMTLTRAGSDTATVTATIPVASATAAGVVTAAQVNSWNSAAGANHSHNNKAVLDGITAAKTASWDGKWTYNEATIKAVKVTSASRADSAASATSATTAATASFITWANVSGKPSSFTPAAHTHNLLVTEGDYRATASTPNDYVNNFRFRGLKNNSTIGLTIGTGSYAYVLGLRGWSDSSGGDSHELAFNNAGIFTRHGATTSWGSWVKIITSDLTGSWATAAANSHTHNNKAVLDGITAAKTASWDTAYGWGNHASAGYVKSSGVTSVTITTASTYVTVDSAAAITSTGTRKIDLAATTKNKIESGSVAFGWGNHASAGYVKSSGVTSVTITTASTYVSVDSAAAITSTGTRKIDLTAATKGKIESGSVAFGWGNHANAGYVKSSGVTSIATGTGLTGGPITTTGTMSIAAATLGKIESGSTAFGWGNHASAGYVKSSGVTSYTLTTASNYVTVDSASAVTSTGTRKIDLATKSKNAIDWVIANSGSAATAITNNHTHSNKALLDSLTNAKTGSWDGKWTYNEATIKAVKVNNATAADSATNATNATNATTAVKLAGTSGSAGIPVYVNAGVPTACNANIVALPLSSSGATTGTLTLVPGKVHKCGTLTGNLTLALGTDNTYTHEAIYCCTFNMGATVRTITLPSGVKVMQNSMDLDTPNCDYEINIMNNVAVIARTEES